MKRIVFLSAFAILAAGCSTAPPRQVSFACTTNSLQMCGLEQQVHNLNYQQELTSYKRDRAVERAALQRTQDENCRLVHGVSSILC